MKESIILASFPPLICSSSSIKISSISLSSSSSSVSSSSSISSSSSSNSRPKIFSSSPSLSSSISLIFSQSWTAYSFISLLGSISMDMIMLDPLSGPSLMILSTEYTFLICLAVMFERLSDSLSIFFSRYLVIFSPLSGSSKNRLARSSIRISTGTVLVRTPSYLSSHLLANDLISSLLNISLMRKLIIS
ncbi:TPA: hypothetical protein ENG04_12295, partial [Candidatus Poribacteria bacterium]|nr:hypothetical protein [Candidatus Poribacteria bacterium]HEX30850.1 hypothetical protein [Candidatus Poribacteria bacterium]